MNRPVHIWSIFAVCAVVLLGAITWVTATAVRLENAQSDALRQAEFEEKARLALWRMDSLLTPIIVEESARPAAHYKAFAPSEGPSPLLYNLPPHALLYFEVLPNGAVISPSVAAGKQSKQVTAATTTQLVVAASNRLGELKQLLAAPAAPGSAFVELDNGSVLSNAVAAATNFPVTFTNSLLAANQNMEQGQQQVFNVKPSEILWQNAQAQGQKSSAEFRARNNVYQQAAQAGINANYGNQAAPAPQIPSRPAPGGSSPQAPATPVWLGSALMLARQVNASEGTTIQGVWLNWDRLKETLVENIRDLFPNADLRAAPVTHDHGARRLAALPVEFVPGAISRSSSLPWTSARFTLAFAWGCMLLAVVAVAVLLHGAVSLSERRGAFVSAVTHELRTPLTTFKMYSEMLAEGMVPEETKRQQYLATLCSEANRLSHLVENVLAYARLERGSARTRVERISLGDLIERILPRLCERAERSEMKLVVDADNLALGTVVHIDAAAVEQILFNLVDNACKYGAPSATEKLIHLEALPDGKFAMLRVRDHGQGISAESAKRLFKPFSKSAEQAAHSAPGIGLGLALCRRLSRSLGGDLRFVRNATRGACFELRLPLDASGAAALNSI
ncbi:MAG TPA: HAMP domain-containing sensor histidine kinase [Verrucomicrobiae bacterium]|jgi:signal transduction histidine kinase